VLPNERRRRLEDEVGPEVAEGHPLHGQTVIAVAKCVACDDVLFSIEGEHVRWAVVHLTFAGHPDKPPWPMSEEFDSFSEARQRMANHQH
jgi:hypothetical protein